MATASGGITFTLTPALNMVTAVTVRTMALVDGFRDKNLKENSTVFIQFFFFLFGT